MSSISSTYSFLFCQTLPSPPFPSKLTNIALRSTTSLHATINQPTQQGWWNSGWSRVWARAGRHTVKPPNHAAIYVGSITQPIIITVVNSCRTRRGAAKNDKARRSAPTRSVWRKRMKRAQCGSKRALLTTLCKILDFPSFKTVLRVIFVIFKTLTITLLHQNQIHSHKLNFFIVPTKKLHLLFSSSQNPSLFSSLHLLISEFVNLLVVNF